jgi:hypothetical protein
MKHKISDTHLAGPTESVEWIWATPHTYGQNRPIKNMGVDAGGKGHDTPCTCEFDKIHTTRGAG